MRHTFTLVSLIVVPACSLGCAELDEIDYLVEEQAVSEQVKDEWHRDRATQVDWPAVGSADSREVELSGQPRTLLHPQKDQLRDLTLAECMRLGLENSTILRSKGAFLSPGNTLLSNPNNAPSFYDPAIQETGVLFGGRGVEAALSAFDANFSTTMVWGRSEQIRNNAFVDGIIGSSTAETASFASSLSKNFAYGGSIELQHNANYSGTNVPNPLFRSAISGNVQARYRHPLLAGSGAEFTRIAGPISTSFGGLSGVTQGVVIARINNDIALTQLEQNLVGYVRDVEYAYWELYLQYRTYDTVVKTRDSALTTWRKLARTDNAGGIEGFNKEDVPLARDQYFDALALSQQSLSQLYKAEAALRRLIGMPVNDGAIIRPSDEPITAKIEADWPSSVASGLTGRVELRRHKWNIKSLELQLAAAQSLVRPRLDFISGYTVSGFGDRLVDYDDQLSGGGPSNMYGNLLDGNHTGWNLGFVLEMPIGLRSALAQVQNIELRLSKARDVQGAQEQEVAHEIGYAFQELAEKYVTARSYLNRRIAARERAELMRKKVDGGLYTIDLLLRAQASLAEAEVAYFRALVEYNLAATDLQFRQGTLLHYNSVYLQEGEWDSEAWCDAHRRASARIHAFDASPFLHTEPEEFVLPHDSGLWCESCSPGSSLDADTTEPPPAESDEVVPEFVEPKAPLSIPAPPPEAPAPPVEEDTTAAIGLDDVFGRSPRRVHRASHIAERPGTSGVVHADYVESSRTASDAKRNWTRTRAASR